MEQLNCLVAIDQRESDDDDGEIYLKLSQHYETLCNNSTFALLLESQMLQKNNESEPSAAPSSLEAGGTTSLRPGSTTTPPSQKSLSTGTTVTVVLFAC